MEVVALGKEISATQALKVGLITTLIDSKGKLVDTSSNIEQRELFLKAGKKFAQSFIDGNKKFQRVSDRSVRVNNIEKLVEKKLEIEKKANRQRPGEIAPQFGIQALNASVRDQFSIGRTKERELFNQLMAGEQSKCMIHAFFAERQVLKIPELKNAKPESVNTVGIVGGGTMGSGITVACLLSGFKVAMVERDEASLNDANTRITKILDESVKRQKITEEKKENIFA